MENQDPNEMRDLERFCLEQAEACATPEGKAALQSLAANYRAAARRASRVNVGGRSARI
jgi:hypothetical protein